MIAQYSNILVVINGSFCPAMALTIMAKIHRKFVNKLIHKLNLPLGINLSFAITYIYTTILGVGGTVAQWQAFADKYNTDIIFIDSGATGESCASYVYINFCNIRKYASVWAYALYEKCNLDIEKMRIAGFSLGGQEAGYLARRFVNYYSRKPYALYGFDPAGPGYSKGSFCQGIQPQFAQNTLIMYCDPYGLGSSDFCNADIIVRRNPQCNAPFGTYCQSECLGTPAVCSPPCSCCHSACASQFISLLEKDFPVTYTQTHDTFQGYPAILTLRINEMRKGNYSLDTYTAKQKCPVSSLNPFGLPLGF